MTHRLTALARHLTSTASVNMSKPLIVYTANTRESLSILAGLCFAPAPHQFRMLICIVCLVLCLLLPAS